ncbi:uncharacterized protein V1510DRAFT_421209 [Dipodascopsis tothii]|uniref:uncharacterized protein n=1 Tax=Dipodascopsis tothii TaxID=44089 RepID=UPI0034CEE43A
MAPVLASSNARRVMILAAIVTVFLFVGSSLYKTSNIPIAAGKSSLTGNSGAGSAEYEKINAGFSKTPSVSVLSDIESFRTQSSEEFIINGETYHFDFLIPLTRSHFNFCRSLYTALINDYPKPTLINWGSQLQGAGARVLKINGIDAYLHALPDNHFALIMDGFDVWYQLPFKALVDRFVELLTEVGSQDIAIFGADKKCWPNDFASPACTNIPESPLPTDVFGPDTDDATKITASRRRYIHHRPRWLNSGNMFGSVKTLRQIYDRANYSISVAPPDEVYSDQMYIANVYGDQDLPMTVDFRSQIFQTMTFSHDDIGFVDEDFMSFPRKPASERKAWAYNKITNFIAPVLHFNGPKEAMDAWWPKMWWSTNVDNKDVREASEKVFQTGGAYTTDGKFLSWKDLCGSANVHIPQAI